MNNQQKKTLAVLILSTALAVPLTTPASASWLCWWCSDTHTELIDIDPPNPDEEAGLLFKIEPEPTCSWWQWWC